VLQGLVKKVSREVEAYSA